MGERYTDEVLRRWRQRPGNVTPRDLAAAAEERGWKHSRTRGSHAIYEKGNLRTVIVTSDMPNNTKRAVIDDLLREEDV